MKEFPSGVIMSVLVIAGSFVAFNYSCHAVFLLGIPLVGIVAIVRYAWKSNLILLNKLLEHKNILNEPAASWIAAFVGAPTVKGKFENYVVEYGVFIDAGRHLSSFYLCYTVQLNQPVKVPWYLRDKCGIADYSDMTLHSGKRLTQRCRVDDLGKALNLETDATIKDKLQRVLGVARRIEQGPMTFENGWLKLERMKLG
jgi:hypothetical protein